MKKFLIIGIVLVAAIAIYFATKKPETPTAKSTKPSSGTGIVDTMPSVVETILDNKVLPTPVKLANGQVYYPYMQPKALGSGFYEWGTTADGTPVVATSEPSTYAVW